MTQQTDKRLRDPPANQSGQHMEMMSLLFLERICYGAVGTCP